ncbi:MAG: diguanylate cyclase [Pirellulales bacterium]
MGRISSTTRITIGLACLSVTILLGAQLIGLIPSQQMAVLKGRAVLSETIAIHCSTLATRNDVRSMRTSLEAMIGRDPDVMYARVRRKNGPLVVEVGESPHQATDTLDSQTGGSRMVVPILDGARPWGTVEIGFRGQSPDGVWHYASDPVIRLVVFVGLASLSVYFLYLRRLLQDLDPSRVIPERVRTTLDTFAEGLLVLDDQERIVLANQSFAITMGQSPESLQGHLVSTLPWRASADAKDGDPFPWQGAMRTGQPQIGEMLDLQPSGTRSRTFMVNASPIIGEEGESRGVFVSFDDVTVMEQNRAELTKTLAMLRQSRDEVHDKNIELQRLAAHDPLTSCLNRRSFFEQLETQWNNSHRHGSTFAYIMADIDHFKSVNDQYGHGVGDKVLQKVAEILRSTARQGDIVCRYGGEEFAILLPQLDIEDATQVAERYRKAIANTEFTDLALTASFGVSATSMGAANVQELIEQADKSLYAAKRRGRDQVCCWSNMADDEISGGADATQPEPQSEPEPTIPFQAVTALIAALAYRDTVTAEHSRRVADLSVAVAGQCMSISEAYLLEIAALLHDIGKIGVPDSILLKPGPLTEEEWKVMRAHQHIGVAIIESAFACRTLTKIIHDYRLPFGGGPSMEQWPTGCDLPLGARILALADAFDSMVSDRAYRRGRSEEEAFGELRRCAGTQFDPELVETFIDCVTARDTSRQGAAPRVSKQTALRIGLQIESLATALDHQDSAGLAAEASRLRKTANKCDVPDIADLAQRLESLAADTAEPLQLAELTRDLLDLCRSTRTALFDPSVRNESPVELVIDTGTSAAMTMAP